MGQGQIVQSIVVAIVTAFASLIIHLFVNARTIFYNRKDFYIKDIATRLEKSEGILGDVNDSMDDISDLLTDIELLQEDQSAGRDTSTAFIARYDFSYYSNLSSSNLSIYRNSEKIRQAVAELRQAVRTGRTAIAEYNSSKTPAAILHMSRALLLTFNQKPWT